MIDIFVRFGSMLHCFIQPISYIVYTFRDSFIFFVERKKKFVILSNDSIASIRQICTIKGGLHVSVNERVDETAMVEKKMENEEDREREREGEK